MKVAIVVDDEAPNRLTQVLAACRARGFELETALTGIGVLVGSVRPIDLERLRATPGVVAVEQERDVQVHSLGRGKPRLRQGVA